MNGRILHTDSVAFTIRKTRTTVAAVTYILNGYYQNCSDSDAIFAENQDQMQ